jgi:hypothetical protein
MGKRELLIVIAFVAMGIVAYEVAAPPDTSGSGFSFSRLVQNVRRQIRGNHASAKATRTGVLTLSAAVTEVRVHGTARGVSVIGENRPDIGYELEVESNGPDEATALQYARQTALSQDDLGSALALDISTPREGTQWAHLVLHVPARLTVRVDGGTSDSISGVAAARLESVLGQTSVTHVAGRVSGTQRGGVLKVTDAGSVDLALVASRATFSGISDSLTLTTRAGTCEVRDVRGPIEIDQTAGEVTLTAPSGPVRVGGTGGRVTIDRPRHEARVDVRRTEVDVTLDAAVPLTLLATDDTLRLTLVGPPAVTLDAVASGGGHIRGDGADLTPTTAGDEQRLARTIGTGQAARVVLRNLRGDIVIGMRK